MHQFSYKNTLFKSRSQNWSEHFEVGGTVKNLNAVSKIPPSSSGRPKMRAAKLVEKVRESVQLSPKSSMPKQSQFPGISPQTCRRVLVSAIKVA